MQEEGYLNLIRKIVKEGEYRKGRNGGTLSVFGERLEFDLTKGFPLLTTKRMFWKGIVEELIWFLRGKTDSNELKEKGVNIWNGNTTREFLDNLGLDYPEGECGPIYGYQWRCFGGDYPSRENGVDQIKHVLTELQNNPHGRRAIFSGWNPKQMHMMCLPPCHILYQFYMSKDGLCCQLYCRSQDVMLGTPYNIASTSLLTTIFATLLGVPAHRVILVTGDTHIYEEHLEGADTQINRMPYDFPQLIISKEAPSKDANVDEKLQWIESLTYDDFRIENYQYHPTIKMQMIA